MFPSGTGMMSIRPSERLETIAFRIAIFAALALATGYFSIAVWDSDAWWHLASGRHIAQSNSLPTADPFGVYQTIGYWGETVLRGQWLGQLSLFGAFHSGGLEGVITLRVILLTLCLSAVILRCSGEPKARIALLLLLFLATMVFRGHTADRPQLFSFAFFAWMLVALDHFYRNGSARSLYVLPPLFLLWANTHPGVIFAVAFLAAFTVLYLVEQRFVPDRGEVAPGANRLLLIVVFLSVLASIITPIGVTAYEYLFKLESNSLKDLITEYHSPFQLLLDLRNAPFLPYYWLLCVAAFATLFVLIRQRRVVDAGLMVFVVAISFDAFRYIPFMVIFSVPVIARDLGGYLDRFTGRARPWIFSAATVFFIGFLVAGTLRGQTFQGGYARHVYPVQLSDIVQQQALKGRIFNTLNWGGYLTWRLWPATTVFIDGRLIESQRVVPYTHILWMTDMGRNYFELADFSLVMVAHRNRFAPDPRPYPLIEFLRNHPQWQMVHVDDNGVLFAKPDS